MRLSVTPAAQRAIRQAALWAADPPAAEGGPLEITTAAMLLGLLGESECRAANILAAANVTPSAVKDRWPHLCKRTACDPGDADHPELQDAVGRSDSRDEISHSTPFPQGTKPSADLQHSLQLVRDWLADNSQNTELASEHILLGLTAADHDVGRWLRRQGIDPAALRRRIARLYGWTLTAVPCGPLADETANAGSASTGDVPEPLQMPDVDLDQQGLFLEGLFHRCEELNANGPCEAARLRILRAIDAAANRAGEGLRVVEDYTRFVLDDAHLTGELKQFRHDLTEALSGVEPCLRLLARETRHDVGTQFTTAAEQRRLRLEDVPAANLVRLEQSLRSLEEFGKLFDADMAERIKQLRYRAYTLQRAIAITAGARKRLAAARLYVLIDGRESVGEFERLVRSLVEAGVSVIQLRDKRLDDRSLLQRARCLAALTSASPTLFVMNDRADLAALAGADGVHVGQQELAVKDARAIVGPETLVGVSTHSIEQAREAVLDGADYIGVGPVFPSKTKQFDAYAGVELLRAVAAEISLPAFAIGGISLENLDAVLQAGFSRIAVSAAVTMAADPGRAAAALLERLSG